MADFKPFSKLIHARFVELSKHELFVSKIPGDVMFEAYLKAFPPGTNPIYKERTEHDCSCCKNFIRNLGNVVAIIDGKIATVWDIEGAEFPYDFVANQMRLMLRDVQVNGLFRTKERQYGAESTRQLLENNAVKTWNHFHGRVADKHFCTNPDQVKGEYNTAVMVLERGLNELDTSALEQVIELIEAKALYRGEEHLSAVREFLLTQMAYTTLEQHQRNWFVWSHGAHRIARFRNTVIGTLVQDLTAGMELEAAVRSFEAKVAPTNYKRPTALITPRMVQDALKTIKELDLEPSLERRFAKLSDISVNNVLWVNNEAKGHMKSALEANLMKVATKQRPSKDTQHANEISIDEFLAYILPAVDSMELLVANTHQANFMSLTAPVHGDSKRLFKWGNDFGWSYDGNITDSIKERVKNAGGNVTNAKLRVSLAWFNYDDLDLHLIEPNGKRIYFGAKRGNYGFLDVDMNAGRGTTREPVENISFIQLPDGVYKVEVDQFSRRETSNIGFTVEVENNGKVTQLSYPQAATLRQPVVDITIKNGNVVDMKLGKGITGTGIPQDKWGLTTETFVKVNTLMLSPNHWDDKAVGNKHIFFILDGCKNPDPARGIYNEFLSSDLEKHRKVFEILGDTTKCPVTDEQLSGLGFSSTRGDTVTVKVTRNDTLPQQDVFTIKF